MHNSALVGRPHGFFLVPRGWRDCFDPLGPKEVFSKPEAWLYLLERACFQDTEMMILGRKVLVRRGEAVLSLRYLANAWNWGKDKVASFLDELEALGVITLCKLGHKSDKGAIKKPTDSSKLPRIVRINNYNGLQSFKATTYRPVSDSLSKNSDSINGLRPDEIKEEKNKDKKELNTAQGQTRLNDWFPNISESYEFEESLPSTWYEVAVEELDLDDEQVGNIARAFWERFSSAESDKSELSWNWYGVWVKFLRRIKAYT